MCISREKLKLLLPVMTAWAAGEIIQLRASKTAEWYDAIDPPSWTLDPENYRIKPIPRKYYEVINSKGDRWYGGSDECKAQAALRDRQLNGRYSPYTIISYTED